MKCSFFFLYVFGAIWPGLDVQAAVVPASSGAREKRLSRSFFEKVVEPASEQASKPPKGISEVKKAFDSDGTSQGHHINPNLLCGVTLQVGAETDKYEDCPATCPYFAQDKSDNKHCTFLCVPAEKCKVQNPYKPIADTIKQSRTCRGPVSKFCEEMYYDGSDSCKKCQAGFYVWHVDGQCYFWYMRTLMVCLLVVLVAVVAVIVWIVDWCCRPTINQEAVIFGTQFRSDSKILMPKVPGERRHCYELTTNLCNLDVAGPGMLLHFRFQLFFIIWPLVVAMVWMALASVHNELWILGTRRFGTPRHNCILVAWGYETQHRLMWTKNLFLVITYLFSFVSFMLFHVWQLRTYQKSEEEHSMKDFAAELKGLPSLKGSDPNVEKDIKDVVEKATGEPLVGVSVAWVYGELEDDVNAIVAQDQLDKQATMELQGVKLYTPPTGDASDPTEGMPGYRKGFYNMEKKLLGYGAETEQKNKSQILEMLDGMVSSDCAVVVFKTEKQCHLALKEHIGETGIKVTLQGQECTLTLHAIECEPATINWQNFGDTGNYALLMRFFKAVLGYYVPALSVWFFAFYCPYAWSLMNFNYDNGAELPGYYGLLFTMIVVGGNATMYFICDLIGDKIQFKYKDSKQTAYLLMYLVACMINVLLDMAVTYKLAFKIMTGLDFKTYHGKRLDEIDSYAEQFETYPMQRSLGENSYAYAWPSTFLIPFLLEPFVTIVVPFYLGKLIVRTHKEVQGIDSEAFLAAFDFDLGRYADILLNVFLGILIFWFPGGYIWSLFLGMSISHCVIYAFDHYRVLHVIPSIKIVSAQVDWWAQVCMIGCNGMILSALAFKLNCESYSPYCITSTFPLVQICTFAGVAHCIVHYVLFVTVVPMLGHGPQEPDTDTDYSEIANDEARNWFSVNPVHCLRSQYKHEHKPYCRYISVGKDHLAELNEDIGCFFFDPEPPPREDISVAGFEKEAAAEVRRLSRSITGELRKHSFGGSSNQASSEGDATSPRKDVTSRKDDKSPTK